MQLILSVALGSALGGVVRFLVSGAVQARVGGAFPAGTLLVNIAGSLLLGALARYVVIQPELNPSMRLFLTAGFCGGFTTFSTFSVEVLELLQNGAPGRAVVYMVTSVVTGLLAAALGYAAVPASPVR